MAAKQVFLSYAHENVAKVAQVHAQLRGMGYEVFFDRSSVDQGTRISDAIRNAIATCDLFVFFLSPEAIANGRYTLTELGHFEQRYPNPVGYLLPVRLAPCDVTSVPYIARNISVFETQGEFTEEVCARAHQLLQSKSNRADCALADAADALIETLSSMRKAREGSAEQAQYKAGADSLVAKLKRGFQPLEGTVVAGATLLRVIGNGNFGTVWEGLQADGTIVAVKVFHLHRLAEGHMLSRFRRSIRAMRILTQAKSYERRDDPRGHIVPFIQADDSQLAFSMKLLKGGDLEDLERLGWTLEKKLDTMLSICAAVAYSHKNGVIHRDIKPANVVLDEQGRAVLTDFDIADIRFATRLSTTVEKSLGTPVFAAPEQLANAARVNESADIYSLGRLLYFFLLERSPGYQIEKDPALENISKFPSAIVEIVRKATQFDPTKRFATVAAMMKALEACQTGSAAWCARASIFRRWARHNWALLVIMNLILCGSGAAVIYQSTIVKRESKYRQQFEDLSSRMATLLTSKEEALNELSLAERAVGSLLKELKTSPTPEVMAQLDLAEARRDRAYKELEQIQQERSNIEQELQKARQAFASVRQLEPVLVSGGRTLDEARNPAAISRVDDKCRRSEVCANNGRCTQRNNNCVAESDSDCRSSSWDCRAIGRCVANNGVCMAASASDCRRSDGCRQFGRCVLGDGVCIADSDADCRESAFNCFQYGRCVLKNGACVAGSDADCAGSRVCSQNGECSASEGRCIARNDTDCRKSTMCERFGYCEISDGRCTKGK